MESDQVDDSWDYKNPRDAFRAYAGSHFQMSRDGVLELYRNWSPTAAEEQAWLLELRTELLDFLGKTQLADSSFHRLVTLLAAQQDQEGFAILCELLSSISSQLDTFSAIRFGEELLRIRQSLELQGPPQNPPGSEFDDCLRSLLARASAKPISVASHYKNLPHMAGSLTDDIVISRATELAREYFQD